MKIIKTDIYDEVKAKVDACGGYCPCVLPDFWDKDTKCMCKEFKEQKEPGMCMCGLFEKVVK